MNHVINITDLSHHFGRHQVLNHLSLRIPAGSIYGFLGRNGAGKTTCIRLLLGLLTRQTGSISLMGEEPSAWTPILREHVGYMGEAGFLPMMMNAKGLISWTKALYPRWDDDVEKRLTERFRLDLKKKVMRLSLGQQRQLAFLLAVAIRPKVLILDEPAANLDTVARRLFLDEIASLARESETTVFFSSHVLSDVERVADHVGILSKGSLIVDEALDELKESIRQVRFFWNRPEPPPVELPGAYRIRKGKGENIVTVRLSDESIIKRVAENLGCSWEVHGLNLEDLFVELTEEE